MTVVDRTRIDRLEDADADVVVVTAGAWARPLLARSGLVRRSPPTRETLAYFRLASDREPPAVVSLVDGGHGFYALPDPVHGLAAGWHRAGLDEPGRRGRPDPAIVDEVAAWARTVFELADPEPVGAETCLYTNTADERFVLERHGRIVVGSGLLGPRVQVRAGGRVAPRRLRRGACPVGLSSGHGQSGERRDLMPFLCPPGEVPRKRHIQFRDNGTLLTGEVMGLRAPYGERVHPLPPPVALPGRGHRRLHADRARAEWVPDAHAHRLLNTYDVEAEGDAITGWRVLMWNDDVEIALCRPTGTMDYFYRNGEGDEVVFVHEGSGTLETVFGDVPYMTATTSRSRAGRPTASCRAIRPRSAISCSRPRADRDPAALPEPVRADPRRRPVLPPTSTRRRS